MRNVARAWTWIVLAGFVVLAMGAAQGTGPAAILYGSNMNTALQWGSGGQPSGSYQQSCQNIRVNGDRLEARCQKRDGGWRNTSIDYRGCGGAVINDDGNLRCDTRGRYDHDRDQDRQNWNSGQPRGNYQQTCQNIRVNGNRLEARCQKRDGGWRDTSINYGGCRGAVINDDGNLRCDISGNDRGSQDHDGDHDWDDHRGGNWQGAHNLPDGPYRATCRNIRVNGNSLNASCQKKNGGRRDTSIDYTRCRGPISNKNGKLSCSQ